MNYGKTYVKKPLKVKAFKVEDLVKNDDAFEQVNNLVNPNFKRTINYSLGKKGIVVEKHGRKFARLL